MVRKQIYMEERHERLLKRISKAHDVSEAELIRQAIERETIGCPLCVMPRITPVHWRDLEKVFLVSSATH